MSKKVGIGFDLGTTYSAVAFSKDGKAEVVTNPEGRKTTPSAVAYLNKERIVGAQAFTQADVSPKNIIFDTKRMIGQYYSSESLKEDMKKWPFTVRKGDGNRPVIICTTDEGDIRIKPEQVGADILRAMKVYAEDLLDEKITDCVITCPASFNDDQRQATKSAAKIAGLTCLRLINEPTAAAVAYGVSKENPGTVLIFDYGGGTFDVTLLTITDGTYEVTATEGDPHSGGKDLDNLMAQFIMDQFNDKKTTNKVDINKPENIEAKKKLMKAVEEAKIALGSATQTSINIPGFVKSTNGRFSDLKIVLSRSALEKLAKQMVNNALAMTLKLLKENNVKTEDLQKVVLVGGFTKMPLIKEKLKNTFGDKVSSGIHPDEAVALGAAIMAEVLDGESDAEGLPKLLLDVTPLALGIEVKDGTMSKIIEKNTTTPCVQEGKYYTTREDQTAVEIVAFQGNRLFARDNKRLDSFKLEGIPKMPKGAAEITVRFRIDADGILAITAMETSTGKNTQLVISQEKIAGLSKTELDKMVDDGLKYEEQDKKRKDILIEKDKLERLMNDCEDALVNDKKLSEMIKEISEWLEGDSIKEKDEFVARGIQLKDLLDRQMPMESDDN